MSDDEASVSLLFEMPKSSTLGVDALVPGREEDVLRLEIAVDDARVVRGDERRADRQHEIDELARREGARALEAVRRDPLPRAAP